MMKEGSRLAVRSSSSEQKPSDVIGTRSGFRLSQDETILSGNLYLLSSYIDNGRCRISYKTEYENVFGRPYKGGFG